MLGRALLLAAIMLLSACKRSTEPGQGAKPEPSGAGTRTPSSSSREALIVLERTGCFGACPAYKVSVHADGSVVFLGEDFVRVRGQAESHVDPQKARELFDRFDKSGFWDWNDEYQYPVTDNPTATLTLYAHGHTKKVIDYPPCHDQAVRGVKPPKELCELERAVDQLTNSRQWVLCYDDAGARKDCRDPFDAFELEQDSGPPRPHPASSPSQKDAGCEPPWFIDKSGVRRIKPGCM